MRPFKFLLFAFVEIILSPYTILAAVWFKTIAKAGIQHAPFSEKIFMKLGVLPVADHYYQPMINPRRHLRKSLRADRSLPGLDMNDAVQLELLKQFNYVSELQSIPITKPPQMLRFYYNNGSFESGDAEYLYNTIRLFKPSKIIEIGSGNSTLMAINAIEQNRKERPEGYVCEHVCIEPYEQPWLESTGAKIIRKKVEDIKEEFFTSLQRNDILFIDSSHVIRPQGDVLYEYLQILPILNSGVLVHVHDIFTPKDYLEEWVKAEHRLWNEQYLLEAFLSLNRQYEIIGAVNYLLHHHRETIESKCPILAKQRYREPGSFWIRKI